MAELLRIQREVEQFQAECFYRNSLAEENRRRENQAATKIQSWFRSCKVQVYLSHLHKKAVIIQTVWWGFTARARFRQMVKEAYFIMKMNFYEEMAVRIQQRWRGFYVRKYIHNFYARKRYLFGVSRLNQLVRFELDEFQDLQKKERDCLQTIEVQKNKIHLAQKLHHHLSTQKNPGIFNSPFRQAPHETELLLRQVKYLPPTRPGPRSRASLPGTPDSAAPESRESQRSKSSRSGSSRPVLPPIVNKKHKGRSKHPGEMWEQCMRCPDLSTCLQMSYSQLEEVQKRLQQKSAKFRGATLDTGHFIHNRNPGSKSSPRPKNLTSQITH